MMSIDIGKQAQVFTSCFLFLYLNNYNYWLICHTRYAGIDYDIQAIDITDPNPIPLLLLAVHLYQRLPQYLPKATMEFTGSLHSCVTRQVCH